MEMKETTIIQGKFFNFKKNPFVLLPMILGILAIVISFFWSITAISREIRYPGGWLENRGWISWFNTFILGGVPGFLFFGAVLFIVIAVILNGKMKKCSLVVTDKRVFGRASFGKRVDLPLNQISSVGQGLFNSISVATSSGVIKFWILENRDEIHQKLTELLANQQKTVTTTNVVMNQSDADELGKYKTLLDNGVITQEEFDAKKKQLLGL